MATEIPNTQADQLTAVLGDERETVEVSTGSGSDRVVQTVEVRPLRLKQFAAVLKLVGELGDVVSGEGFDAIKFLGAGDVAIKLLSIATGVEQSELEQLELDEAALLAGAVYRVNKSFFQKKGAAILKALGLDPELAQTLKSSSSSLSAAATGSTTSANTP
jgi:hypothetical protein